MTHDLSHISPVWGRVTQLVAERGEGCHIYTTDGQQYLDFTSGIGVTNTGHSHPAVVKAVQEQAAKFMHAQVNCYFHEPLVRVSHALNAVTPPHLDSFFLSNSGAEAVEASVKLARHATGRTNVIVFQGSFHGRTAQTMAMTTAKTVYRVNYQPLPGGIFTAPFPHAYRYGMSPAEASNWALRELDMLLHTQSAPQETAAMIIEPVLGEGGYVPAPPEFLRGLRQVCDEYGILLIVDEVQSGFGRTGKFFAHEHSGVRPDIMVMAKGMGSGFPVSGIAAGRGLMSKWQVGTHGGTYGGNAMGCAAVEATIQVIQNEGLVENAAARGRQLMDGLAEIQSRHPVVGDVRGLGLMVGTEFSQPGTNRPAPDVAKKVAAHALEQGHLILLTCGMYANTVRWIPPLVVTEAQIDQALQIFENAIAAAVSSA
ncbi:MAG: aminotransferase class III-fold pyridoxal phosphate-dependent enzyme [Chloroflexi bacterium]|nr:MAG: aminotransferase class III-fold pyridoxal phosphate-dependent enzyme [Chloroflexota bacterium]